MEGWKVLYIPSMVHISFGNPVSPTGRGECICLDIVHEKPEGEKYQLFISSDTEYDLEDSHRMAVTTSDLNKQFRKVHKCSLKIYLGEEKK